MIRRVRKWLQTIRQPRVYVILGQPESRLLKESANSREKRNTNRLSRSSQYKRSGLEQRRGLPGKDISWTDWYRVLLMLNRDGSIADAKYYLSMTRWSLFLLPCAFLFSGLIRADSITITGDCNGTGSRVYSCSADYPQSIADSRIHVYVNNAHDDPLSYDVTGIMQAISGNNEPNFPQAVASYLDLVIELQPNTGNWDVSAWAFGYETGQPTYPVNISVNGTTIYANDARYPQSLVVSHPYGTFGYVDIRTAVSSNLTDESSFVNFGVNLTDPVPTDAAPEPSTCILAFSGIGVLFLLNLRRRFSSGRS